MTERDLVKSSLDYYNKQIEILEDDDELLSTHYLLRSVLYEEEGNYEKALKDALMVVKLDDTFWKGHHQSAKMYLRLGKIEEAEKILNDFKNDDDFSDLLDLLKSLTVAKGTAYIMTEDSDSMGESSSAKPFISKVPEAQGTEKTKKKKKKQPDKRQKGNKYRADHQTARTSANVEASDGFEDAQRVRESRNKFWDWIPECCKCTIL